MWSWQSMRPGSTVLPDTSTISASFGHALAPAVVTVSTRSSRITIAVLRTGAAPVPSMRVPPLSTIIVSSPPSTAPGRRRSLWRRRRRDRLRDPPFLVVVEPDPQPIVPCLEELQSGTLPEHPEDLGARADAVAKVRQARLDVEELRRRDGGCGGRSRGGGRSRDGRRRGARGRRGTRRRRRRRGGRGDRRWRSGGWRGNRGRRGGSGLGWRGRGGRSFGRGGRLRGAADQDEGNQGDECARFGSPPRDRSRVRRLYAARWHRSRRGGARPGGRLQRAPPTIVVHSGPPRASNAPSEEGARE
jgi:hypothetical protein